MRLMQCIGGARFIVGVPYVLAPVPPPPSSPCSVSTSPAHPVNILPWHHPQHNSQKVTSVAQCHRDGPISALSQNGPHPLQAKDVVDTRPFATHSMTTTTAMPILQTFNSPPPSPLLSRPSSQSPRGSPLRLPAVANAIVKFRRGRHNSPAKDFPIVSSSGAPQTHPTLAGDAGIAIRGSVPLIEEQRFLCRDAVDVKKLLRMLRGVLLEEAQTIGASVLVDEQ